MGDRTQRRFCFWSRATRLGMLFMGAAMAVSCEDLRRLQQRRPAPQPLLRHGAMRRPVVQNGPDLPNPPALANTGGASATPRFDRGPAAGSSRGLAGWRQVSTPRSVALGHHAWLHEMKVSNGAYTAEVNAVVFDSRHCTLRVIDQPSASMGGGVISDLMRGRQAIAGVNGGFFHPNFEPLGVAIAGGRKAGQFTSNKLIAGSVLTVGNEPYLVWNSEFLGEKGVTDLIQSGPRLVDLRVPIAGLKRAQSAPRTFVATDGKRTWAVGVVRSLTLGDLGELLATPGVMPGLAVHRALNLDGGNSSAFWARSADGREISQPGWSTVRNYLAVVPR